MWGKPLDQFCEFCGAKCHGDFCCRTCRDEYTDKTQILLESFYQDYPGESRYNGEFEDERSDVVGGL